MGSICQRNDGTRGTQKEHVIRATLEAIAYQTVDVLKAMEQDLELTLSGLKVDGGASANHFLMQFQSDILGIPVEKPTCIETTALGAAYLAGLAVGYWSDEEALKKNWKQAREYQPDMNTVQRAAASELEESGRAGKGLGRIRRHTDVVLLGGYVRANVLEEI